METHDDDHMSSESGPQKRDGESVPKGRIGLHPKDGEMMHAIEFSKNQLEAIFDHLEPMCLVNRDLKIIRLNKAMASFLSRTYKQCLQYPVREVFQQWDYGLLESNINLVFSYRRSIQVNDFSIIDRGKKGWYEITFYPVSGKADDIDECVIYFKNITELFLTKKILYQQYKKLEEQQLTVENQHLKLLETKDTLNKMYQSLQEELNVAREVQQGILPAKLPEIPGLAFYSSYEPISQVGGDIFDILSLSPTKVGIFIGDVSGHGLPAAFVGAMVKMALIDHAKENVSPKKLFDIINRNLHRNLKSGHYLTAFYGVLDTTDHTLLYGKASHPQPVLIRDDGEVVELETRGMFLGLLEEPEYEEKKIQLRKGDKIYFFTDGYFEIQDENEKRLTYPQFKKMLARANHLPIDKMHRKIVNQLKALNQEAELEDDRTFLAMEVTQSKPEPNFPPAEYFEETGDMALREFSSEQEYQPLFEEMETYLTDRSVPEEMVRQINVCALELANNALEHGNRWDQGKKIHLAYTVSNRWVKISFLDQGKGFKPEKVPSPVVAGNVEKERGRGIYIVSSYMDEVYFNARGNGVTILKQIPFP